MIIIKHRVAIVYIYASLCEVQDFEGIKVLKSVIQMFDRFYTYISNVDLEYYSVDELNTKVRDLYTDLNNYKSAILENDPVVEKINDLLAVLVNCLSNYSIEEVYEDVKH